MSQQIVLLTQVLQQLEAQQKMLAQLDSRLDNLEASLGIAKELEIEVATNYEYPALAPIQKAEAFDTIVKRKEWWDGLEAQWQKSFIANLLRKVANYKPTDEELAIYNPSDEELQFILESPTLIVVGAKGAGAKINFELTNLSGIKHLTNLTTLIVTHHQITSLAGIEYLDKLESLFVNVNQLSDLKEVHYLPNLTQLYCNDNQIKDLLPLTQLTKLTTIHCNNNPLSNLAGITAAHSQNLKKISCLPNDKILPLEIKRVEALGIRCRKG